MPKSREQARALTEAEQAFADAVIAFGATMDELRRLAAEVSNEGGDPEYAVLSTIPRHEDQQLFRANWPMLRLVFGL
jgi:hypothetical protein